MPLYPLSVAVGVTVGVNYSASTGRVSNVQVDNQLSTPVYAEAVLTDGRAFGKTYVPGTATTNFPNNVVSLQIDQAGEPTFTGLASLTCSVLG